MIDKELFIQRIVDTVKEAEQRKYSDSCLKMDLKNILDEVEDDIRDYNLGIIDSLKTSYRNCDSDWDSYDELLDEIRNQLY